ncbi:hypothetical protein D3C86_1761030 [compost metagenome]
MLGEINQSDLEQLTRFKRIRIDGIHARHRIQDRKSLSQYDIFEALAKILKCIGGTGLNFVSLAVKHHNWCSCRK